MVGPDPYTAPHIFNGVLAFYTLDTNSSLLVTTIKKSLWTLTNGPGQGDPAWSRSAAPCPESITEPAQDQRRQDSSRGSRGHWKGAKAGLASM